MFHVSPSCSEDSEKIWILHLLDPPMLQKSGVWGQAHRTCGRSCAPHCPQPTMLPAPHLAQLPGACQATTKPLYGEEKFLCPSPFIMQNLLPQLFEPPWAVYPCGNEQLRLLVGAMAAEMPGSLKQKGYCPSQYLSPSSAWQRSSVELLGNYCYSVLQFPMWKMGLSLLFSLSLISSTCLTAGKCVWMWLNQMLHRLNWGLWAVQDHTASSSDRSSGLTQPGLVSGSPVSSVFRT